MCETECDFSACKGIIHSWQVQVVEEESQRGAWYIYSLLLYRPIYSSFPFSVVLLRSHTVCFIYMDMFTTLSQSNLFTYHFSWCTLKIQLVTKYKYKKFHCLNRAYNVYINNKHISSNELQFYQHYINFTTSKCLAQQILFV